MKNDPTFKFVAAILLAGVIIAFSTTLNHSAASAPAEAPTVSAAPTTE